MLRASSGRRAQVPPLHSRRADRGLQPRRRGLPYLLLAALLLFLPLGLSATGERPPTLLELPRLPVPGANPYLSWLPAGEEPEWEYWQARMALEGRERRQARGGFVGGLTVDEAEPVGVREVNDLPVLGEAIPAFGALADQEATATIRGTLLAPPILLAPAAEPDGAIPLATSLGLAAGTAVAVDAVLGDGAHGSGGSGRGDFDFYRLTGEAGQLLEVTVRTPEPLGDLDPIVALYGAGGELLAVNDNVPQGGILRNFDSYLAFELPAGGEYFLAVGGYNPDLSGGDLDDMLPADPFDAASGPGTGSEGSYVLGVALEAPPAGDVDFYRLELRAGDVLGATVLGTSTFGGAAFGTLDFGPGRRISLYSIEPDGSELLVSSRGPDLSFIYPELSPLPGGGEASVAYVIEASGTYAVGVEAPPYFDDGAYALELGVARPALDAEPAPRRQTLFLDFDGATLDGSAFGSPFEVVTLSPLAAFLGRWGLSPGLEDELIRRVVDVFTENLAEDLRQRGGNGDFQESGLPGDFDVEILNSLDHGDPSPPEGGGRDVSRVVFGGTVDELGLLTIGIAESVDVGNFATGEAAIVLLDLLSEAPDNGNSLNAFLLLGSGAKLSLVATTLGNIGAHEAGHLLANFHTRRDGGVANLMDRGGRVDVFAEVGEDGLFGTGDDPDLDFGPDAYEPAEVFAGTEDTLDAISFGAPAGGPGARLVGRPEAWDFGPLPVGGEAVREITLSNEGNESLLLGSPSLSGGGGAFELSGGGGGVLAPGATRALPVRFQPGALGAFDALLTIPSDDLRRPLVEIGLDGQGGEPSFRLGEGGHDFGTVEYGAGPQAVDTAFRIFNDGPGSLTLQPPLLLGPAAAQFRAEILGSPVVAAGGSTTLRASFAPGGPVGALRAVLAVRSNDPARPRQDLGLTGVANGPDVAISPFPAFSYGQVRVGMRRDRIFRVTNEGNRNLAVTAFEIDGEQAAEFALGEGALPFTLAPGEERPFVAAFLPAELGTRTAVLRLHNDDPDEGDLEVALAGEGSQPDISADPPVRRFGNVSLPDESFRRLQVVNSGGSRLTVTATEIAGPHAEDFAIVNNGAPFTVSPDSFWTMRLRFRPTDQGPRRAFLRITSDDPDTPVLDVPLEGTGGILDRRPPSNLKK